MDGKQRFVVFCAAACNAIAVLFAAYPLLKGLGFQDPSISKDLLPFWANRTFPVNSLFMYVSGVSIVVLTGGLYLLGATTVARTKSLSPAYREIALLDAIVSLVALACILNSSSAVVMGWTLAARLVVLGVLLRLGSRRSMIQRLPKAAHVYDMLSVAFCVLCTGAFLYFCLTKPLDYIRGPILAATFTYFWPLYGATLGVLVTAWLFRLVPLSSQVRSAVAFLALLPIDIYVIWSLALFTFRNDSAYFDASIIIAPMHDILFGKDIGINIVSTYGFLNIYLLAVFCKLLGITDYYKGLSYLISGCFALGYSVIYLLLRYHTRNIALSLLGLIFIVSTNFNYVHVPIHWLPQCGLYRFGAFIPIMVVLYFLESFRDRKLLEWAAAGVIAVSMLLLPESGIYALVAISAIVVCRVAFLRDWLFARFLGKIIGCLAALGVVIEAYMLVKHGQRISWADLMYFQRVYGTYRIAMENFKGLGVWTLVSTVYAIGLYVLAERVLSRRPGPRDAAWMFLAGIGPLMMIYFVGKQGLSDLSRVQVPALILAIVGANHALRNLRYRVPTALAVYGLAAFAVSSSWVANDRGGMKDRWLLTKPIHYATTPPWQERFYGSAQGYAKVMEDVEVIKQLVPPDQGLAIISRMDTMIYIAAERKSVFKNKFYAHFFLESEMKENAELINSSGTKYFFVDRLNFQQYNNVVSDHVRNVLDYPVNKFKLVRQLNFIDVYEVIR
jgi:hypothetical protein